MGFRKGQSGNPSGRPAGSRNNATLAVEALLDGEAGDITRKAIELAKGGDITAIRICMDRIAAPRRDRPVAFAFPTLSTAQDAVKASTAIVAAVSRGDLTTGEAAELSKVVEGFARTLECVDLSERLERLEKRLGQ